MPKTTTPAQSVDYKSPKQDIWKAYKELAADIEANGSSPVSIAPVIKASGNLKQKLGQQIDQISSTLQSEVYNLLDQLSQASEIIDHLGQSRQKLEENLKQTEQESKKAKQREAEEYDYEFNRRKQRQEEELKEQRAKAETEIATKKAELKNQQDELEDLRKQVATFEDKLTKAAKDAIENTTKQLSLEFTHQKALADQKYSGVEQLLQQKIDSLEQVIKSQDGEVKLLQTSLKETQAQMTRISERAVEKTPAVVASVEKKIE